MDRAKASVESLPTRSMTRAAPLPLVAARNKMPRIVDDHIFGHSAVDSTTETGDKGCLLAEVLRAFAAPAAAAATPGKIDSDRGVDLKAGDALAELVDPAGRLVPHDGRNREEGRARVEHEQVPVA